MTLSKNRQKIVKIIGIVIALQGLIWVVLSLTGIVVKNYPPNKLTKERKSYTSYEDYLSQIIYNSFMSDVKETCITYRVIRPVDFHAFLWVYLVMSCIWITLPLDQYFAIKYKKPRQSYDTLILGITVLLTSVIDCVFVALLLRDYAKCNFLKPLNSTKDECESSLTLTQFDCKLAKGIIMTVAARGYALWMMNVVLGIYLITIGVMAIQTPALLAYGNNTIPRIKIPEKRKTPSPIDEMMFFGDNPSFTGSNPYMNDKNRNSMPAALNHKGQNLYY